MKTRLLTALAALFLSLSAFAQTGSIKGTVTTSDGKPAEFVNVMIKGTTKGAVTNTLGEFIIQNAPTGEQILITNYVGTKSVEKTIMVKDGEATVVDFAIAESASELGEVVVTGQKRRTSTVTKTMTPLENLPISIQIVNQELMQQQLVMDTRDAVKNVSGVTVTGTYNGGYAYYNSRGFWMNTWTNFRRNGMMIWNMGHHHNDNIEQVEVLKGPASILYGDVAPGGIMNFATKKPLNYDYKRFELRTGEYGLFRPTFDISGPANEKGTLLYRLNATYEKSNSFRDMVNNETVMFAPALTWMIHPKLQWDVEGTFKHDHRVGDPGLISPDGTFEGVKQLPVSRFLGEPNGTYTFNDKSMFSTFNYYVNDNWKIRNQTYYTNTTRTPYNIYFGGIDADGELTRTQYYYNQWFKGWGNTFDVIGEMHTGNIKHQVLIGADYMINSSQYTDGIWETMDTTISVFNPEYGIATLKADPMNWSGAGFFYERMGLYVQDQVSMFGDKLHMLIGARYNMTSSGTKYFDPELQPDDYDIPDDNPVSPRFGIVYKPIDNVSAYGSYSQSYEMNGTDWIDPTIVIDPTNASQVEFGIKTSVLEDRLGITVSAFQIDKKNIYGWMDAVTEPTIEYISWDEAGLWATYQGGHHQSKGIELDVNGKLFDALTVNATYAYVDARIIDDPVYESGNMLEGNAVNSGSLWLNYGFNSTKLKGLQLGYGLFYKDKFFLSNANNSEEIVDAYYSMDASLGYTYKNITTRLNITNLTNNIGYLGSYGVYEPLWVRRAVLSVAVKF